MKLARLVIATAAGSLLLAACSGDDGAKRTDVLAALADEHVVPAYAAVTESLTELQTAVESLCAAPSDPALQTARDDLAAARAAWKRTDTMRIGPDMHRRSVEKIDWPADPERIDQLLDGSTPPELTVAVIGTQMSSALRGLGGIEHVLFEPDALEAVAAPRTCDYLVAVAAVAAGEAAAVSTAWTAPTAEAPAFRDTFAGASDAATADMTLDDLVTESLNLLQRMTEIELKAVRGAGPDAPPPAEVDPSLLEQIPEGPAALGVADARARLDGLRTVYVDGFGPLLGSGLRDRIGEEIAAATAAFEALGDTGLRNATSAEPAQVRVAYDALKELQVTISTEVVGKLGVTVGFSDADGDASG